MIIFYGITDSLAYFRHLRSINIIRPQSIDTSYNVSHDLRTTVSRCVDWTVTVTYFLNSKNIQKLITAVS